MLAEATVDQKRKKDCELNWYGPPNGDNSLAHKFVIAFPHFMLVTTFVLLTTQSTFSKALVCAISRFSVTLWKGRRKYFLTPWKFQYLQNQDMSPLQVVPLEYYNVEPYEDDSIHFIRMFTYSYSVFVSVLPASLQFTQLQTTTMDSPREKIFWFEWTPASSYNNGWRSWSISAVRLCIKLHTFIRLPFCSHTMHPHIFYFSISRVSVEMTDLSEWVSES